jgi:hypothetical protein
MKTLIKKTFVLPLLTCFVGLMSCGNEENEVFRPDEGVESKETENIRRAVHLHRALY